MALVHRCDFSRRDIAARRGRTGGKGQPRERCASNDAFGDAETGAGTHAKDFGKRAGGLKCGGLCPLSLANPPFEKGG
ncbi:MAG: hypothetical protein BroJett031_19290 [Betaproteobacteria bacterium]|nr:MAG: hypothetical protein BroJett031_19290 [Betaproteobacteria bacterium]